MSALSRTRGRRILIVSILLTAIWLTFVYDALNATYVSVPTAHGEYAGVTVFSANAHGADQVLGPVVGVLSVQLVALVVATLMLLGASWYSRGRSSSSLRFGWHGVETTFVRFPENNHDLTRGGKPRTGVEHAKRIADWFDAHP